MTEEEFTKEALEKGFEEHWIKSCINDCKKDIEKILKEGLIEPIPLERLIRQTATKIKSAIESNLEPKSIAVPVFLATVPSIISDTSAVRYRM